MRHSLANHLLESGYDIPTAQEVLGHRIVANTMIYTPPAGDMGPRPNGSTSGSQAYRGPMSPALPRNTERRLRPCSGTRNRAVELLRDAIAQGAVDPRDHLHSEPAFAALHGYPPLDDLLGPRAEMRVDLGAARSGTVPALS